MSASIIPHPGVSDDYSRELQTRVESTPQAAVTYFIQRGWSFHARPYAVKYLGEQQAPHYSTLTAPTGGGEGSVCLHPDAPKEICCNEWHLDALTHKPVRSVITEESLVHELGHAYDKEHGLSAQLVEEYEAAVALLPESVQDMNRYVVRSGGDKADTVRGMQETIADTFKDLIYSDGKINSYESVCQAYEARIAKDPIAAWAELPPNMMVAQIFPPITAKLKQHMQAEGLITLDAPTARPRFKQTVALER